MNHGRFAESMSTIAVTGPSAQNTNSGNVTVFWPLSRSSDTGFLLLDYLHGSLVLFDVVQPVRDALGDAPGQQVFLFLAWPLGQQRIGLAQHRADQLDNLFD